MLYYYLLVGKIGCVLNYILTCHQFCAKVKMTVLMILSTESPIA